MKHSHSRWLLMLGILALSIVLAGCGNTASSSSQPAPTTVAGGTQQSSEPNSSAAMVRVTAKEFSFSLDPPQAQAGSVTFAVQNDGAAPHDFKITGNGLEQKTDMLKAGETASLTVDLQPGTYSYVCTVPGHDVLGMKGTITVN